MAEGAIDRNLQPITPEQVKQVLIDQLGLDTRVTTLGHTQRGGSPCAYDRILASLQGCEAVEALLSAKPEAPSYIIGLAENAITRQPMMEAVAKTQEVAKRIAAKDFDGALALRDPEFEECLQAFYASSRIDDKYLLPEAKVSERTGRYWSVEAETFCIYSGFASVSSSESAQKDAATILTDFRLSALEHQRRA